MNRWTTLDIDAVPLGRLGCAPVAALDDYTDAVADRRLKPRELSRKWDYQQWNAEELDLGPDRDDLASLPATAQRTVELAVATFVIGEYSGLDLLAPIMRASPDEEDLFFLSTQVADEYRHTRLMLRLGDEVLGWGADPRVLLRRSWDAMGTHYQDLADLEARIVADLARRPDDYVSWLRAITHFHLVTEGVLALSGQRHILRLLTELDRMPATRAGFAAMCRDESRHVSYGLHALRIGLAEGHSDEVYGVLEEAVPVALNMWHVPGNADAAVVAEHAFRRGMRSIDGDLALADRLVRSARERSASAGPATR